MQNRLNLPLPEWLSKNLLDRDPNGRDSMASIVISEGEMDKGLKHRSVEVWKVQTTMELYRNHLYTCQQSTLLIAVQTDARTHRLLLLVAVRAAVDFAIVISIDVVQLLFLKQWTSAC